MPRVSFCFYFLGGPALHRLSWDALRKGKTGPHLFDCFEAAAPRAIRAAARYSAGLTVILTVLRLTAEASTSKR